MKKFKSVLAFGDSHVAGCELLGPEIVNDYVTGKTALAAMDAKTKPLSFSNLVAEQLGVPCYNYALSGGGNERGLRMLPKALAEHPDSLVLFGYVEHFRKELYYPDAGKFLARDETDYIQVGVHWYNESIIKTAKKHKLTHPINTDFVENMLRQDEDYTNMSNTMFYVEQACKNFAVDLVHIFIYDDLFDVNNPVSKLLDASKLLTGNWNHWAESKGYPKTAMGHYSKDAHVAFSKLILEHIGK